MSHTAQNDTERGARPSAGAATPAADPALEPVVQPEHAELLASLDRMLTIGSYYPPSHEKYREVADATHAALRRALAGARTLELEVTDAGLALPGSFAAADSREAKRLHQLLNPLNVALLEIDAETTTADLHAALAALRKHQSVLSSAREYQEIAIEGLPATVRATSRSLYVKTLAGGGAGAPRKAYEAFDPNLIPDSVMVETPDGQMVEREFLAVVRGIMQSGDPLKLKQLQNAPDDRVSDVLNQWIPDEAIARIKDILQALEETNTDAMMLQHLIGHAQAALELVGDPELVELVFQKLRKETDRKASNPLLESRPKPRNPRRNPVTFTMTREQMRELIDEVDGQAVPIADLMADTGPDCLGICQQVLLAAPMDALAAGALELIDGLVASSRFGERELRIMSQILRHAMRAETTEAADLLVPALLTPLRERRPERLGWLWLSVWEGLLEAEHKEMAWPYVVDDLLRGLGWQDPTDKLAFYQELTDFPVKERYDLLARLERLPALSEKILADDLFTAPAPLLYPIHQLLLRSSLSEEHGPRLIRRLQAQQMHPLVDLLLRSLGEYDNGNAKLYQAMLDQGVVERVTPTLAEAAGRYLKAIVTRLEDEELDEEWVPDAIAWMGRLQARKSEDVLQDIISEKKWLFFPVWPAPAREAARKGLDMLRDATADTGPQDGRHRE